MRLRLTEESRLHPSRSFIYTWGVMGSFCTAEQQRMERWRGLCGPSCQALTAHCVKLVIISPLKPCPVCAPLGCRCRLHGARRHGGPWSRMCQGGKSLLWWRGKHYGQLYRQRLLWHIQKWSNKFEDWQWRDGRLRGRSSVTAQQQMFTWPPLQALGQPGHRRRC